MTDGSSVDVLTLQGSLPDERALAARYGEGVISVCAETSVAGTVTGRDMKINKVRIEA